MARVCDVAGCGEAAKQVVIEVEEVTPDPKDIDSANVASTRCASDLCERHRGMLNDHLRQLGFI